MRAKGMHETSVPQLSFFGLGNLGRLDRRRRTNEEREFGSSALAFRLERDGNHLYRSQGRQKMNCNYRSVGMDGDAKRARRRVLRPPAVKVGVCRFQPGEHQDEQDTARGYPQPPDGGRASGFTHDRRIDSLRDNRTTHKQRRATYFSSATQQPESMWTPRMGTASYACRRLQIRG
jgi:hypothetical protein